MQRAQVEHYATAVVEVLATDFPSLGDDETTAMVVRETIARHTADPPASFKVILDSRNAQRRHPAAARPQHPALPRHGYSPAGG